MGKLVALVGFLILFIGLAVLVSPVMFRDLLRWSLGLRWVDRVGGTRVVVGAALVIAVPATRLPGFVLLFRWLLMTHDRRGAMSSS